MSALRQTLRRGSRITQAVVHPSKRHSSQLARTPLYELHKDNKAKIAPFAGFEMPLFYAKGGAAEHKHTRSAAGLFDVSHMVQSELTGKGASDFLSYLTPSSISTLKPFHSTLSVLLNEQGGVIDDLMITRHGDEKFYIVTNAGRRNEDLQWIKQQLEDFNAKNGTSVSFTVITDKALLAIQGPSAVAAVQKLTKHDFAPLVFGQSVFTTVADLPVHAARSGYTGEDGLEIAVSSDQAIAFAQKLLEDPSVELAGLAARDSLRIEAGLCLYGHELDETITPIEAALAWVVGKDRRQKGAFIGSERVLEQLSKEGPGPARRRVGLIVQGAPAREGAEIFDESGTKSIGTVTSGIPSPTLGQNVAIGYVQSGLHKKDTPLKVLVRNKLRDAQVAKLPFVPAKYYRGL